MRTAEFAAAHQVSRRTVLNWIRRGLVAADRNPSGKTAPWNVTGSLTKQTAARLPHEQNKTYLETQADFYHRYDPPPQLPPYPRVTIPPAPLMPIPPQPEPRYVNDPDFADDDPAAFLRSNLSGS